MSKPTLVVSADLLKSHIDQYVRKDGAVVQAHDDKRQAAAPKPGEVGHHEHTQYGAYFRPGDKVKDNSGKTHEVAEHNGASVRTKGGEMFHPTKLKHAGESKAAAPAEFGVHHSELKEGDHLYDKHGQKVDEVEGFSRGINSPKVHTRAGYTHGTRSDGFLPGLSNKKPGAEPAKPEPRLALPKKRAAAKPAPAKTGSAAPARTVNVGTDKYPMHAKSSERLPAKHEDGSTHHVGGFEPPSSGKGDHTIHHDGKTFSFTGKSGKNMKSGEASYEYSHDGDKAESRAWVTHSGHLMND